MGRSCLIPGCGIVALASLIGGATQASVNASSATDGSLLMTQAESVTARQSVVTGAMGVPITADIIRSVAIAAVPALPTPAPFLSAAHFESQTINPAITPRIDIGTTQQASFVITGDQDRSVSIAIPTSVPLSKVGGGGDVQFDTTSSIGTANIGQSRLAENQGGTGELAFDVGGRVQMKRNVVAGAYAGVLRVTVQYN